MLKNQKFLKKPLRIDKVNPHKRVKSLRVELDEVQKAIDIDPSNDVLHKEEALYLHAFYDALIHEERFLKQRAKIEWLRAGDSNLAYFHKVVKSRVSRRCIDAIVDSSGISIDGENVNSAFISHYVHFLDQTGATSQFNTRGLFMNIVSKPRRVNDSCCFL